MKKRTLKTQLKDRLEVGDELFFYDRKTILEKTKVISVDKKAKTATLENRVVISRYPDINGNFTSTSKNKDHLITLWDDSKEQLYNAHISRKRVETYINTLNTLLRNTYNILQAGKADLEVLIKVNKKLTKIFQEYNN